MKAARSLGVPRQEPERRLILGPRSSLVPGLFVHGAQRGSQIGVLRVELDRATVARDRLVVPLRILRLAVAYCQAQNPRWYDKAIASYGRAIQLHPEMPTSRAALAAVYEKTGHKSRARVEYQAALKIMPGHSEASAGMLRLESATKAVGEGQPWWRKLFGKPSDGEAARVSRNRSSPEEIQ